MLLNGHRTTPEIAASPWDFVTLPEEDRATATCTEKLAKIAYGSGNILTERQTDRQTQKYRHVHHNTSPYHSEVTRKRKPKKQKKTDMLRINGPISSP